MSWGVAEMPSDKVACQVCGVVIQAWTAARTGGLCMPCSQGGRPVPEDFDRVRRKWSRKVVPGVARRPTRYAERYQAGDRSAVWSDLHRLDLRRQTTQDVFEDAAACVRLAMRRVRANVEWIVRSLPELGYTFAAPDEAHRPPTPEDLATLEALEREFGPLPLTLRIFYEEVGSVDLAQHHEQLVGNADSEYDASSPLRRLGEHDPLYVATVSEFADQARDALAGLARLFTDPPGNVRPLCWISPDECDKAYYSGGDGYSVHLPEPAIDFPLVGSWSEGTDPVLENENQYPRREGYGPGEFFIDHLRACFRNGGFRGASDPSGEGPRRRPGWEPLDRLAARQLDV